MTDFAANERPRPASRSLPTRSSRFAALAKVIRQRFTYSLDLSPSGLRLPVFGWRVQPSGSFSFARSQADKAATAACGVSYHQPSNTNHPSVTMIRARPKVSGVMSTQGSFISTSQRTPIELEFFRRPTIQSRTRRVRPAQTHAETHRLIP